jgi:hypothetical protein
MDFSTTVLPPIEDDSGYRVRMTDVDFVGVDPESLRLAAGRQCPLGMDRKTYNEFIRLLFRALDREGVDDAEVRIQGSSVKFFSGGHKRMPFKRTEIGAAYLEARGHLPLNPHLDSFEAVLARQWPADEKRPLRRMFDSMHILGIDTQPSDYDVQISSDQLIDLIKEELSLLGLDPEELTLNHPTYNFIRKDLVDDLLLNLSTWTDKAISLVDRQVSVALFPLSGPPECADPSLSSHHKADDWVVRRTEIVVR